MVTGGGSGIGLATVERFVAEGARVVVGDIDKARLAEVEQRFGDAVRVVECDVTDEAAVEALAATASDAFGRLDVAFANAGIGTSGLIVDSDVDDWKRTVDVCLVGPMLTIKHTAPRMTDGGAIVVTASLNAVQPGRGMSAYCAAKAGAAMLVQVAAMELGPAGHPRERDRARPGAHRAHRRHVVDAGDRGRVRGERAHRAIGDARRDRQPRCVPRVRRSRLHDRCAAPRRRRSGHDALPRRARSRHRSVGPAHAHVMTDLDPALEAWVIEVTGASRLTVHRGVGGASRAGHAIDAHFPDGSVVELWLRSDPGFGPQSTTLYSLPREAAVYRALGPTPVRVAALVAAHPTEPAFLMARVEGASRFAQIADPDEQLAVAQQFMEQLATLHRLDPTRSTCPSSGVPGSVREHVLDEIAEWETQYDAAGGGVPVITLAFAWLRAQVPDDGDWPVVLVQGDTGPGNFMYSGAELVAITDWELAHWGDLHDDLAWILVRDTLERFPDLAARLRDYETASGLRIDPDRLAYFRVLAQLRATIGTLAGLRSHDARGEIAWQLIYNTLHTRCARRVAGRGRGHRGAAADRRRRGRRIVGVGVRHRTRRPARRRGARARARPVRRHPREGHRPPAQVPPRRRRVRAGPRRRRTRTAQRPCSATPSAISTPVGARSATPSTRARSRPKPRSPTASTRPRATPRSCARRWACSPIAT